jgi:hypothetical protein
VSEFSLRHGKTLGKPGGKLNISRRYGDSLEFKLFLTFDQTPLEKAIQYKYSKVVSSHSSLKF